jgi:hypothetical protein
MIYYKPKHFRIEELVPPEIMTVLKDESLLVMDYRILKTIDIIREYLNKPVIINTWHVGNGNRLYCGFRPHHTTVGAQYSQHKFGRAVDCLIVGVKEYDSIRREILNHQNHFSYITCIEDKVNWLHIDCRATDMQGIVLINP